MSTLIKITSLSELFLYLYSTYYIPIVLVINIYNNCIVNKLNGYNNIVIMCYNIKYI